MSDPQAPAAPMDAGSEHSSEPADHSGSHAPDASIGTKHSLIFWGYFVLYVVFFCICVYFVSATDKLLETMSSSDSYYYGNQVAYAWKQGQ